MSVVTDIILITCCDERGEGLKKLQQWLKENFHNIQMAEIDEYASGNKAMQCGVFACAINHFDTDSFTTKFREVENEFEEPECVQLLIKEENEDRFTILEINK